MKTKNTGIFALGLIATMTLISCGGNNSTGPTTASSTESSPSSSIADELVNPFPVVYIPGSAPRDYEGKTPVQVNADGNAKQVYIYANNYMGNVDSYAIGSGKTNAKAANMPVYSQLIYTLGISVGTQTINQFITTGESIGSGIPGLGATVNGASRQLEDLTERKYEVITSAKGDDNVSLELGTDGLPIDGSVAEWGSALSLRTRTEFIRATGHDLFGLTSYYVPNVTAIKDASLKSSVSGKNIFTFQFSTTSDGGATDASEYYALEQKNILEESLGSFASSLSLKIDTLSAEITINDDWSVSEVDVTEKYTASFKGTAGISIETKLKTSIACFDDETTIADDRISSFYADAKTAFGV